MLWNLYLVIANWLLVLNTLLNTQSLRVALHVQKLLMTRSRVFTTQAEAYIWIISILIHKICPNSFTRSISSKNCSCNVGGTLLTNYRLTFVSPAAQAAVSTSACCTSNKQWRLCCMKEGARPSVQTRGTRHGGDFHLSTSYQSAATHGCWPDSHWLYWADQNTDSTCSCAVNWINLDFPQISKHHSWCFWFRCFEPLGPFKITLKFGYTIIQCNVICSVDFDTIFQAKINFILGKNISVHKHKTQKIVLWLGAAHKKTLLENSIHY